MLEVTLFPPPSPPGPPVGLPWVGLGWGGGGAGGVWGGGGDRAWGGGWRWGLGREMGVRWRGWGGAGSPRVSGPRGAWVRRGRRAGWPGVAGDWRPADAGVGAPVREEVGTHPALQCARGRWRRSVLRRGVWSEWCPSPLHTWGAGGPAHCARVRGEQDGCCDLRFEAGEGGSPAKFLR